MPNQSVSEMKHILRRHYHALIFSVLTVALLQTGCGRVINRTVERHIREALPRLLGPARQYHVHVDGSPLNTVQGKLSDVTVDGDDVQFANGLLMDHLRLDLRGIDYDTGRGKLKRIDSARFAATIGQKSLDVFIAGEAPPSETLRHIDVILSGNNSVTIRGQRVTFGLNVPFELSGPVRVVGPKRVELDATRLKVIGIPISGVVLKYLKSRFENGIDLSSLPFPIQLTGVSTEPGNITISGAADVAALMDHLNGPHP